jgi:hypothetical protein
MPMESAYRDPKGSFAMEAHPTNGDLLVERTGVGVIPAADSWAVFTVGVAGCVGFRDDLPAALAYALAQGRRRGVQVFAQTTIGYDLVSTEQ